MVWRSSDGQEGCPVVSHKKETGVHERGKIRICGVPGGYKQYRAKTDVRGVSGRPSIKETNISFYWSECVSREKKKRDTNIRASRCSKGGKGAVQQLQTENQETAQRDVNV